MFYIIYLNVILNLLINMSYQYQQAVQQLLPPAEQIKFLMAKDKPLMIQFSICIQEVKNNPRYNDKVKYRRKIDAIKSQFIDFFLIKLTKKIKVCIDIKNHLILNYFKDKNGTLNALYKNNICPLNCRALGGICLCRNSIGGWFYPPIH